ncbi:MAG: hypothetical protein ACI837_002626 [Crocinitomicaceae bacterium]|jgi:hypothetical protein
MAPFGFISSALTTLKNNARPRRGRHSMNEPDVKIEETSYDFPEVSDEERKVLVDKILGNRKTGDRLIYISVIIVFLVVPLFYLITIYS